MIAMCPNCKADNPEVLSRIDAENIWCSACDQSMKYSISDAIDEVMEDILSDNSLGIIRDALGMYFEAEVKSK